MQTLTRPDGRPALTYDEMEEAYWRARTPRNGVVRPPYGLDWIGRPFFDLAHPGVGAFVRGEGAEIVLTPALSGGRVSVSGAEILVRR